MSRSVLSINYERWLTSELTFLPLKILTLTTSSQIIGKHRFPNSPTNYKNYTELPSIPSEKSRYREWYLITVKLLATSWNYGWKTRVRQQFHRHDLIIFSLLISQNRQKLRCYELPNPEVELSPIEYKIIVFNINWIDQTPSSNWKHIS